MCNTNDISTENATKNSDSEIRADAEDKLDALTARPVYLSVGNKDSSFDAAAATGVDSLYLSYPGIIELARDLELRRLKELAKSELESENAEALYEMPEHLFAVQDKGSGRFPFVLVDNAYRISLSGNNAASMPLASVQIKSDWLVNKGVIGACAELDVIIEQFGKREDSKVSRADLFVDFTCSFPFDSLPVTSWVSRARRISTHTMGRAFTGYSIGLGGDISARLYDKTREIKESGKDYLKSLWIDQGWDQISPVWRLEFQFKRRVLTEHEAGTVEDLMARLGALWRYSTTSWLKLTIPNLDDQTQSRWPMHPVWAALCEIDWQNPDNHISIPVRTSNPPSNRQLFINGMSGITSYMAREGITNTDEAFQRFKEDARNFHEIECDYNYISFSGYLIDKASAKARRFHLAYPGVLERSKTKTKEVVANAYRKARDGE